MSKKNSQKTDMPDILKNETSSESATELENMLQKTIEQMSKQLSDVYKELTQIKISIATMDQRVATIEKLSSKGEPTGEVNEIKDAVKNLNSLINDRRSSSKSNIPRYKFNSLDWEKIGKGIGWIIIATGLGLTGVKAAGHFFQP